MIVRTTGTIGDLQVDLDTDLLDRTTGTIGALQDDLDTDLDSEEPGKIYVLTVNDDGDYDLILQVFNKHYTEQEIRIDFDDKVSASYFGIQVDEYTSAFNIRDNDNENIVIKKINTKFIRSDGYLLYVTILLQIKALIEIKKKASKFWPFLGISLNLFNINCI